MPWALLAAQTAIAAAPARPVPSQGPGAATLLLYSESRSGYALENTLELLKTHLRRMDTQVEAMALTKVDSNQLAAAKYIVVFAPNAHTQFATNILETVAATNQPVLWIGYGPGQLEKLKAFDGQFHLEPFSNIAATTNIGYRARQWFAPVAPLLQVSFPTQSIAEVVMTLRYTATNTPTPLCWRSHGVTFFGAVPDGSRLGQLFADMLLDFYGVRDLPPSRVFLRIDDYQCASDHSEFQRKVDFLASRGHPFLLSVTATCPGESGLEQLTTNPEYIAGLRYAQARGGRIVLRGYAPEVSGYEFWDLQLDQPLARATPQFMRERLHKGVQELLKHGLFPVAWQTPGYAASRAAFDEIARVFSTGVERVQLSDATERDSFAPNVITLDPAGRLIVPENLGFIATGETNGLDRIKSEASLLLQLRGSVAGCVFHAYQPLPKLVSLVETLESLRVPFLDLAGFDNAVRIPGTALLTGESERKVRLGTNTTLRWRAFNRAGKLLAEDSETVSTTGERTVLQRGQGDYELFEFTEGNP